MQTAVTVFVQHVLMCPRMAEYVVPLSPAVVVEYPDLGGTRLDKIGSSTQANLRQSDTSLNFFPCDIKRNCMSYPDTALCGLCKAAEDSVTGSVFR